MAEVVEIDIPGIGKVEAKNAATEATLKELVNAIIGLRKTTEKADKEQLKATQEQGKTTGGSTGIDGKLNKEKAEGAKNMASMNRNGRVAGSAFTLLGKMGKNAASGLGDLGTIVGNTANTVDNMARRFGAMSTAITDTISDISQIGDSLQGATRSLRVIPIVGGTLSTVLGAAVSATTGVVDSFQKASSVGATFGGSVNAMARSASSAGMTIDQFASLLAENGNSLMLLGGTTEVGAKRFSDLSKIMRSSGVNDELMRMGFSTKDINQGIMNYASTMGRTGQLQRMSTAQLASESGKYMKELDALAKVTGVSRQEKQREVDLLKNNAKVQAAIASIEDPEQRRKMQAYILSFPAEAQGAIADMISTGNMSTEEAVKLGVMLPGVAKEAMQFGRTLNAGGKINDQQINQSKNNAVLEAQSSLKRNKTLGLYADDLGNAFLATGAIASQGIDAYANSLEEQTKATQKANMAEEVEKAKQQLAGISNQFMLFLANSGAINTMMTAFQAFTSFSQAVLMPAFSILAGVLNHLVPIISTYVVPMFSTLGNVVLSLSEFILSNLTPVMITLGVMALPSLIAKVIVAGQAAMTMGTNVIAAGKAAGVMAMNLLKNVGALALMALKMLPLVLAAGALYLAFKGVVWVVKNAADGFEAVTDGVKWLFSWLKTGMLSWYKLLFTGLSKLPFVGDKFKAAADSVGELIEDEEKSREEIAKRSEDRTKRREDRAQAEKNAADAKAAVKDENAQKRKEEREKRALARRSGKEEKAIDDKVAREKANDTPTQDLSDPIKMLKSFADKNNSAFIEKTKEISAAAKDKAGSTIGAAAKDKAGSTIGTTPPVNAQANARATENYNNSNEFAGMDSQTSTLAQSKVASPAASRGTSRSTQESVQVKNNDVTSSEAQSITSTSLGLDALVKNGITPTTIAFQNLNRKAINPMMEAGIKFSKLAQGPSTAEKLKAGIDNTIKSFGVGLSQRSGKDKTQVDATAIAAAVPKFMPSESDRFKDPLYQELLNKNKIGTGPLAAAGARKSADLEYRKLWEASLEKEVKAKKANEQKTVDNQTAVAEGEKTIKALNDAPASAQETSESLLSSLNMKMDELIRVGRETADINSKQLSVQRNNSGDLFA